MGIFCVLCLGRRRSGWAPCLLGADLGALLGESDVLWGDIENFYRVFTF